MLINKKEAVNQDTLNMERTSYKLRKSILIYIIDNGSVLRVYKELLSTHKKATNNSVEK